MTIKVNILQGLNWSLYQNYCKREGLSPSKLDNLEKYIDRGGFKR